MVCNHALRAVLRWTIITSTSALPSMSCTVLSDHVVSGSKLAKRLSNRALTRLASTATLTSEGSKVTPTTVSLPTSRSRVFGLSLVVFALCTRRACVESRGVLINGARLAGSWLSLPIRVSLNLRYLSPELRAYAGTEFLFIRSNCECWNFLRPYVLGLKVVSHNWAGFIAGNEAIDRHSITDHVLYIFSQPSALGVVLSIDVDERLNRLPVRTQFKPRYLAIFYIDVDTGDDQFLIIRPTVSSLVNSHSCPARGG